MPSSRGCQTCRIRRIKCDQTHPICQRCQTAHRTCHGLSTSPIIHHENPYASGQRKRPRGPRSSVSSRPRAARTSSTDTSTNTTTIVYPQPQPSLHSQAIALYLHQHTPSSPSPPYANRGSDDFISSLTETYLPTLTLSSSPSLSTYQFINSTLLEKALTPLALAYFARAQNCPSARTEAARAYSAVLREARSIFASMSLATGARIDGIGIDVLLLMIFFMSRYEDTVHPRSVSLRFRGGAGNPRGSGNGSPKGLRSRMLASCAHQDGAVAVLRVWVDACRCRGGHIGSGGIPSEVVKLTRRAVMRSALMRGMMLPEWMHSGEVFGEATGGVEERLDALAVRVVELRGRSVAPGFRVADGAGAGSAQTSCEERWIGAAAAAKRVYSEGNRVRSALEAWKGEVDWIQREMVAAKEKVYYFPTLAQAVLWCHYLTLAMLSESVCLRVLKFVKHEIAGSGAAGWCDHLAARDLAAAHEVDLKTLARQLIASVPFVLGQVHITENAAWGVRNATWDKTLPPSPYRASLLVWPLTVASGIDRLEEQQRWFKAQLGYLGRVTGVGVLECAEGEEWLTF